MNEAKETSCNEISIDDIVAALEGDITDDNNNNNNSNINNNNEQHNENEIKAEKSVTKGKEPKKGRKRRVKDKDKDKDKDKEESTSVTPDKTEEKQKKKRKAKDKDKDKPEQPEQIQNNNSKEHDNKPKKRKKNSDTHDTKNKTQLTSTSSTVNYNNALSTSNDPKDIVLNYMLTQNRPYSVINIFDNLHGQVKKAQLIKILESLTEDKKLICKEYNTKIYLANQDNFPPINAAHLSSLDLSIDNIKKENAHLKEILNSKHSELKAITSEYTDAELDIVIEQNKKKVEMLRKKVEKINNNTIEPVPEEKMKEKEKELEKMKVKYKKIKRICLDVIDRFVEGMDMKRSKFIEESGIEDDKEIIEKEKLVI
jgi:26S proteasome regulatory subunit (ATPase 3-interacting protein)